jgi:hypothetical protein
MLKDKFTVFAPPEWAYELSTENPDYSGPAFAFFDDLPTADDYVQAAFFRMVHERAVGRFHFRDNVRIISAGNRTTDKAAAKEMPTPLRNRFMHIDIDLNFEAWREWALANGVFPNIIAYLKVNQTKINTFDPKGNEYKFATPRTWHMASDYILNQGKGCDLTDHYDPISGLIGEGVTTEFLAFNSRVGHMKSPKEILANPEKIKIPKEGEIDLLHATTTALTAYVQENPSLDNLLGCYKYATRLNIEFGVLLVSDVGTVYLKNPNFDTKERLKMIKSIPFEQVREKFEKFMPENQ